MRVFLVGYYGFGNWGDELSLMAVSRELAAFAQRQGISLDLSVLSRGKDLPVSLPTGTVPVPRRPVSEIWRELRCCDGVVIGGGSLLQDASSLRSLLYYWTLVNVAIRLKKPVVFFRCGLGPFQKRLSRFLMKRLMRRLTLFVARDADSAALAAEYSCSAQRILEGRDPVFSLFEPEQNRDYCRDRIAVFLRTMPPDREAVLRMALCELRETTGRPVECVGFHQELDRATVERLGRETGCRTRYFTSTDEVKRYFLDLDCLFTMRLHPAIIASRMGVPWFAFDIDPKIAALCRWWENKNLLRWEKVDSKTLAVSFQNRAVIREQGKQVQAEIDRFLQDENGLCEAVFASLQGNL
ncbi:MAG TPA: polysaccharide pyruvyl transferase family protein [Atribacteraceae bacterium]|nr:polysaccharide pyruvyl transferase family protein [Atribacteraceae bacterium]